MLLLVNYYQLIVRLKSYQSVGPIRFESSESFDSEDKLIEALACEDETSRCKTLQIGALQFEILKIEAL